MSCTCVVGLQWGDEAKGKIVDLIADQHEYVVRYNGGANAGHTIVSGPHTFKLSLLPSGVIRPQVQAVIGNGVVIYPPQLLKEIDQLLSKGLTADNLRISDHAHVIFPYHQLQESLSEAGPGTIGTTGRGIGPCYQDKCGRSHAIRVGELLRPTHLRERLREIVPFKNRVLAALAGPNAPPPFDADALADEYASYGEQIRSRVTDTGLLLRQAVRQGQRLLFEAAQGSLLDVDHGTYPYVTSSNSTPAGIWPGSGVSTKHLSRTIGVVKAYTSRVGRGPFPTELHNDLGELIRRTGREFGTVTGRPRRVGWLDLVALRYTADLGGVDELALMLLDVLSVAPELAVCVAYDYCRERLTDFPADAGVLAECRPVYQSMPGWCVDISGVRRVADLPSPARAYIDFIAEQLNLPIRIVSVGPERTQTIVS